MVDGYYYVDIGGRFKNTETRPAKYGRWFLCQRKWHMYDYSQWVAKVEHHSGTVRGIDLHRIDYAICGVKKRDATTIGKGKETMAKKGICPICQQAVIDWMRIEGAIGEGGGVDLGGSREAVIQYQRNKRAKEPTETPWYDL